jgi:hypothetical protein
MDNPEKPATLGIQDDAKYSTICVAHHYTQTNTNNVRIAVIDKHGLILFIH